MKTMARINAYLSFNGNCREAMIFYKTCLEGELTIQMIEGSPIEYQCPFGIRHYVLHASLVKGDLVLMASDMIEEDEYVKGNSIALSLNCASEKEIRRCFRRLAVGGMITHPLKTQSWGATFGVLTDRYGVKWILNYDTMIH
jgi:PhnB protein